MLDIEREHQESENVAAGSQLGGSVAEQQPDTASQHLGSMIRSEADMLNTLKSLLREHRERRRYFMQIATLEAINLAEFEGADRRLLDCQGSETVHNRQDTSKARMS